MRRTPLMLVGDGPQEPTGLGRILRDLGTRIHASDLPVDLCSVGGCVPPVWTAWPHYALDERLQRAEDWGASYVEQLWSSHFGDRPGVLWVIWDPSRLVYYQGIQAPVQKWAYPAVDAGNGVGSIGGPAGQALAGWDRVIAYGRWASQVVKTVRGGAVPYLPHGIHAPTYTGLQDSEDRAWARQQLGPHCTRNALIVGCVATNQPRKDLALYFQTLGLLRDRGLEVFGWLHTDVLVKAWSVGELIDQCGLGRQVAVSLSYTDVELAAMYQACDVTIAPGLGEGFGYPIVESLASGVPVVHGDCAGGRELVPKREWRFPVREVRLEGIYGLQRPVFRAEDVANAVERALVWKTEVGAAVAAGYCRGAVAHLDWESLWPRWYAWIKAGL